MTLTWKPTLEPLESRETPAALLSGVKLQALVVLPPPTGTEPAPAPTSPPPVSPPAPTPVVVVVSPPTPPYIP